METRPPTITRILIAAGFALSCFALALFLWIAFGGPIPLTPEGYRFDVPFDEATQLAQESDVRISGRLGRQGEGDRARPRERRRGDDRAAGALRPDPHRHPGDRCARRPCSARPTSSSRPASNEAEPLPEGGDLPRAQVAQSVQLDEIFRTFDARTRAAFSQWMQGAAGALRGRGEDLSIALGSLDSFAGRGRQGAAHPRQPGAGGHRPGLRRGRGLRRALRAPGPALRPDPQHAGGVLDHGAAKRGPEGPVHRAADLPARVAGDARPRSTTSPRLANPVITQLRPSVRQLGPTLTSTAKPGDRAAELLPRPAGGDQRRAEGLPGAAQAARQRPAAAAHPPALVPRRADPDPHRRPPVPPRGHRLPRQRRRATNAVNNEGTGAVRVPAHDGAVQPRDALRLSAAGSPPTGPTPTSSRRATSSCRAAWSRSRPPSARAGSTRSST